MKSHNPKPAMSMVRMVSYNSSAFPRDLIDQSTSLEELGIVIDHPVRKEFKNAIVRYIKLHNDMMAQRIPGKFIILTPSGQLCNRMRSVVSAFTLALLTDRALLVPDFGYGETRYSDLFKDPGFELSPPTIPAIRGSKRTMDMSEKSFSVDKFACSNFLDPQSNQETVWKLSGSNYINTYLYANPFLQEKMQSLFLDDDLYRPILFYLFRPQDHIVQQKEKFIRENLGEKPYRIGFHIRTEYPITDVEWNAYKECAVQVTPKHLKKNESYWFASTDTLPARALIREKLRDDVVFYYPDKFIVGAYKAGLEQALVDILVTSESDQLFLTPHSSFSRVIAMYSRTPRVYLVTDYGIPEQDPHRTFTNISQHCYRLLSKEDCAWHGHRTSAQKELSKVSCYTPAMKSDFC
eukprot:TRINITY_DN12617_c0_g1_i1.p1 TRINITY_DN12617_c0_g1~~TRINITY_DN12617_c0_g1_i1.p1  ORF type:complete len:453 (+),score=92.81 TRINITY_DN12617_c0_g1_i1:140-1360(+)